MKKGGLNKTICSASSDNKHDVRTLQQTLGKQLFVNTLCKCWQFGVMLSS